MSQQNDTGVKPFTAENAIAIHQAVKLGTAAGEVDVAGATDPVIGFAKQTVAAGDPVSVELLTKPGTIRAIAAAAITKGDTVYEAAAGRVSTSAGSFKLGVALEAAGAAAQIIEILPCVGSTSAV